MYNIFLGDIMSDFKRYQQSICEIPEFLYKYLELDSMNRLKDISLLCGMDYASPHMYDFAFYVSRYDHSLNVALITWRLTHDKTQTLAALFHDISTPVFSHVIDYMNGDYINQESTENKNMEVLLSTKNLLQYLKEDNINIEDIIDFKRHTIVDLPRPCLCADRLDNTVGSTGMAWAKKANYKQTKEVLDSMYIDKNEYGQDEICLSSLSAARYMVDINDYLNELSQTKEDNYMMMLLADLVRLTIDEGIITYDDLYKLTEHDYLKIIKEHLYIPELNDYYHTFKTVKEPDIPTGIVVKDRVLNPIVNGKRYK